MAKSDRIGQAARIMLDFAARTGLTGTGRPPRRYLWTDAFALCNFLTLFAATGDGRYRALALQLIDQVHRVLARHRPDSAHRGWISGLSEEEGRRHPLAGGLRIGKKLDERAPGEAYDPEAEWDRDGQYFHYLTKWIHALTRAGAVLGEPALLQQAGELAVVAVRAFTYLPPGERQARMYWKMSIDLSRPLVAAMGQHDPLDGYVTLRALIRTMTALGMSATAELRRACASLAAMCEGRDWLSTDPLGIGGLLFDACRMTQMVFCKTADEDAALLAAVLQAAGNGLAGWRRHNPLSAPAAHRLPFRELGLAIGLKAAAPMARLARKHAGGGADVIGESWQSLAGTAPLAGRIEAFWMNPANRNGPHWHAHEDINSVMLATSLAPEMFLSLDAATGGQDPVIDGNGHSGL